MTDNPLTSQWFTMHYGDGCIGIAPCHVPLPSFEWIGCCSSLAMICYYGSALLLSHSLVEASMLQVSCYFVMVGCGSYGSAALLRHAIVSLYLQGNQEEENVQGEMWSGVGFKDGLLFHPFIFATIA